MQSGKALSLGWDVEANRHEARAALQLVSVPVPGAVIPACPKRRNCFTCRERRDAPARRNLMGTVGEGEQRGPWPVWWE